MSVTYTRIDKDTVRQTITVEAIITDFKQSKLQKNIDDEQTKLDNMPAVKPYPTSSTPAIDEWNIKNSNKFEKENLKTSIDENTKFLNRLKVV